MIWCSGISLVFHVRLDTDLIGCSRLRACVIANDIWRVVLMDLFQWCRHASGDFSQKVFWLPWNFPKKRWFNNSHNWKSAVWFYSDGKEFSWDLLAIQHQWAFQENTACTWWPWVTELICMLEEISAVKCSLTERCVRMHIIQWLLLYIRRARIGLIAAVRELHLDSITVLIGDILTNSGKQCRELPVDFSWMIMEAPVLIMWKVTTLTPNIYFI